MTKKKYLNSTLVTFGVPGEASFRCGYMVDDEIYDYLKKLNQKEHNCNYCATYSFSFFQRHAEANLLNIDACVDNVYRIKPLCQARSCSGCFRNIKLGKCKDPFVIENIGKIFFPDKYSR